MSKKERVKVTIDLIKTGMIALLSALFGIFAFVVVNIETISVFQIIASILGILIILIISFFLVKTLIKQLNILEETE